MDRRLPPLAALGMAALIATGCSSTRAGAAASSGSASRSSAAPTASASSSSAAPASAHDKGVEFAECMRANGVPHFPDPDPDPDPKGDFTFGVDVTPAVFTKAADACRALQPPGALDSTRTPTEQAATLRFAQCVRDNGVKDFPDPVAGQPLINTDKIPSTDKPGGMGILNAATAECGDLLKQAVGGQG